MLFLMPKYLLSHMDTARVEPNVLPWAILTQSSSINTIDAIINYVITYCFQLRYISAIPLFISLAPMFSWVWMQVSSMGSAW